MRDINLEQFSVKKYTMVEVGYRHVRVVTCCTCLKLQIKRCISLNKYSSFKQLLKKK